MTRHYTTPATRERDATAWAALVSGAADLAKNPLPDDWRDDLDRRFDDDEDPRDHPGDDD